MSAGPAFKLPPLFAAERPLPSARERLPLAFTLEMRPSLAGCYAPVETPTPRPENAEPQVLRLGPSRTLQIRGSPPLPCFPGGSWSVLRTVRVWRGNSTRARLRPRFPMEDSRSRTGNRRQARGTISEDDLTEGRPMRILIAEDSRVQAVDLRRRLESLGHQVTVTFDGRQAWDVLQSRAEPVAILEPKSVSSRNRCRPKSVSAEIGVRPKSVSVHFFGRGRNRCRPKSVSAEIGVGRNRCQFIFLAEIGVRPKSVSVHFFGRNRCQAEIGVSSFFSPSRSRNRCQFIFFAQPKPKSVSVHFFSPSRNRCQPKSVSVHFFRRLTRGRPGRSRVGDKLVPGHLDPPAPHRLAARPRSEPGRGSRPAVGVHPPAGSGGPLRPAGFATRPTPSLDAPRMARPWRWARPITTSIGRSLILPSGMRRCEGEVRGFSDFPARSSRPARPTRGHGEAVGNRCGAAASSAVADR